MALNESGAEDVLQGLICLIQSGLLCIFSLILGSRSGAFGGQGADFVDDELSKGSEYDPPTVQ